MIFLVSAIKKNSVAEYIIWADKGEAAISFVKEKYPSNAVLLDNALSVGENEIFDQVKYSYKELDDVDWDIYENEILHTIVLCYKLCENKRKCSITLSKNDPQFFSGCICKEKWQGQA